MSALLQPGLSAQVSLTVGEGDTAVAFRSGDVPVLATPRVVALCEEATMATLAGALGAGDTSVGTRIECDHLAPSRVGVRVTATSTLVEVDGNRLGFHVVVADDGGGQLATARMQRVIVERRRFLNR